MTTKKKLARKRPRWELRLYIADHTPRSVLAVGNLRRVCEEHLKTRYRITIVDIVREPEKARAHNILATPTLVRVLPLKNTTVIGTLSDTNKLLQALGIPLHSENAVSTLQQDFVQIGHA